MAEKWTEEDVLRIMAIMRAIDVDSLNRIVGNNPETDTVELGEFLEDPREGPEELAENTDRIRLLKEVADKLPPRERRIITLRYGLEDGRYYTLDELGNMYGVTRERIRQVELRAISRMRHILICKYKLRKEDI